MIHLMQPSHKKSDLLAIHSGNNEQGSWPHLFQSSLILLAVDQAKLETGLQT
jgi:hypothetical protein